VEFDPPEGLQVRDISLEQKWQLEKRSYRKEKLNLNESVGNDIFVPAHVHEDQRSDKVDNDTHDSQVTVVALVLDILGVCSSNDWVIKELE